MNWNRLPKLLGLLMGVSLALAACAPSVRATQPPVTGTQAPVSTQPAATEAFATEPATDTTKNADTIIIGTWQEPRTFLDYANAQAIQVEMTLIYKPRFTIRSNFGYQANPVLVDGDLPSFENGGAVLNAVKVKAGDPIFNLDTYTVQPAAADTDAQQMVVTGKLKSGLKWDDGEPLTAHDLVFAFNKNCEKDSDAVDITYCPLGSVDGAGGLITSYEATDDTTIVMKYAPGVLDAIYQVIIFGPEGFPIPEHLFKDMSAADIAKDERANGGENNVPVGYGPYKIAAWKKGDSVTFAPNPNWSGPAPKTPNIIYKFYSDSTALAAGVIAGEVDATSGITGLSVDQAPYMKSVAERGVINYSADKNAASFEMLYFNYNDPTDKTFKKPNPVLSEFCVRKAISLALDRKQMVETIYYGDSAVVQQPQLPQMVSYDESLGILAYDPEQAKKVLDDCGWKDTDGDGIREKNGVKASTNYLTTSGNAPRQKASQVIQANLKDIGIELNLTYQPSSVTFSKDGLYGRNFDMLQFANVFSVVDPGNWLFGVANCGQIPTPENGMAGANYAGWCEKAASDASVHAGYQTLDPKERKADWDIVLKSYFSEGDPADYRTGGLPLIPLYTRPNYLATAPGLHGAALDPTEYFTWNIETWTLAAE